MAIIRCSPTVGSPYHPPCPSHADPNALYRIVLYIILVIIMQNIALFHQSAPILGITTIPNHH